MLNESSTSDNTPYVSTDVTEEYVPCNLCGAQNFTLKFVGADRLYGLPGKFSVVECNVCGLMYVNPRPNGKSLTQYYPQIYWDKQTYWGFSVSNRSLLRAVSKLHAILLQAICCRISVPELTNGKLLDIGCGGGSYLASMKQTGWDAYGVEPSPVACELARRNVGSTIFNGTVEEVSFPNTFFDVITMDQVLEHMQDPTETLSEVHRILKADGVLAISIPDAKSWESKMFGSAWFRWELPRHLYHFSRSTIAAMLEKNGFSVIDVKYDAHPFGVISSIQRVLGGIRVPPKITFALAYPLSFLLAIVLGIFHSSGSMVIYARK